MQRLGKILFQQDNKVVGEYIWQFQQNLQL